jgi:hypothetical protein
VFAEVVWFVRCNVAPEVFVASNFALAFGTCISVLAYSAVTVCSASAHFSGFSFFMRHFDQLLLFLFLKFDFEHAVFEGCADGVWNNHFWQV